MHNNYIKELLGFKDILIKNISTHEGYTYFTIETKKKENCCPCCASITSKVHDYRYQLVKDAPILFNKTYLYIRKRRYKCKKCGKQFYEDISFLPKYYRFTNRLTAFIANKFTSTSSVKEIASDTNLSSSTVLRILKLFHVSNTELPEVLSIDEFKGNTGYYKYQVALMDNKNKKVIDILPSRKLHLLCQYFKKFPISKRENVKYFVMDLWENYKSIAMTYFPKAKIIADRFHFVRYACNALDSVRIRIQKDKIKSTRKYIKGSKRLLMARPFNLKGNAINTVNHILNNFHDDLRVAYLLKEQLLDIIKLKDFPELAKRLFKEWIKDAESSKIPEFIECAKTYRNWFTEITNSFYVPYNNGVIEGTNNKIKVLKRNAYGFRNFDNFSTRIMLCTK